MFGLLCTLKPERHVFILQRFAILQGQAKVKIWLISNMHKAV